MSKHVATVEWTGTSDEEFLAGRFSRVHSIRFDGGAAIEGSAAPGNAPAPFVSTAAVDPEEMFVASLSSCHMLWFLHLARNARIVVRSYMDEAEGIMGKGDDGRVSVTHVTLRPYVSCDADASLVMNLHHKAHEECFIANSVKTVMAVEPRLKDE